MKALNEIIAQNLVELRKKGNLTQSQLAEKMGYSDKTISKWELGNAIPGVEVLKELSDFYGVDIDYLISEHEETADVNLKKGKTKSDNRVPVFLLINMVIMLIATSFFVWSLVTLKPGDFFYCYWPIFVWAFSICCLISALIAHRFWKKHKSVWITFASLFFWVLITSFYVSFGNYTLWYIFIIGVPIQACMILIANMK